MLREGDVGRVVRAVWRCGGGGGGGRRGGGGGPPAKQGGGWFEKGVGG